MPLCISFWIRPSPLQGTNSPGVTAQHREGLWERQVAELYQVESGKTSHSRGHLNEVMTYTQMFTKARERTRESARVFRQGAS